MEKGDFKIAVQNIAALVIALIGAAFLIFILVNVQLDQIVK